MMMRKNQVFPWKEVLNLTDQEFCDKISSTLEVIFIFIVFFYFFFKELKKIKEELKSTNELDTKKRFFSHYFRNSGALAKY